MRLLALNDQRGAALAQFEACRSALQEELGVEPGTETTVLYERIRDEMSQLKDSGEIGAVGVSCHDFGALEVAAAHPWVDVIFARINHKGGPEYSCDALAPKVAEVLKTARAVSTTTN